MKAIAIEVTATRATILLRPCWVARLFGARESTIDLERGKLHNGEAGFWVAVASRRRLRWIPHSTLIENALDFRQRTELPTATARHDGGSWLASGVGQ